MLRFIADQVRRDAQAADLCDRAASTQQTRNSVEFVGFECIGERNPHAAQNGNQGTCTVDDLGTSGLSLRMNYRRMFSPYAKDSD